LLIKTEHTFWSTKFLWLAIRIAVQLFLRHKHHKNNHELFLWLAVKIASTFELHMLKTFCW